MAEPLSTSVLYRLLEVSRSLGATESSTKLLQLIIDAMRDVLQAERATVFRYLPATHELVSTVAHGGGESVSEPFEIRISASAGIAGAAAQKKQIINIPDAYADPRFNRAVDRETGFCTRSLLTIPLTDHTGGLVGVAQVLNRKDGVFGPEDENIATALAAQGAVALKRALLVEDRIIRLKLESDLEIAREIQQNLLPRPLPPIPGFECAALSEPADETGGDAFDVIEVPGGATLMLGDATGHGVGPAISITQVRSMLRMATMLDASLRQSTEHINRQLTRDLPIGRFVTAWFGSVHASSAVLRYISFGQAPLVLLRAGGELVELEADTAPLGIMPDLEIPEPQRLHLEPGDLFVVASDGYMEAENPYGQQLGKERIHRLLSALRDRPALAIVQALREMVDAHRAGTPIKDDQTIILLKRGSPG